jgi:hypothetical protein
MSTNVIMFPKSPALPWREAAAAALSAKAPPDCWPHRWIIAQRGLLRFLIEGWGEQAALMGWTGEELYRVPPLWMQTHLTGVALLIGNWRVAAVTEASIVVETPAGFRVKFRRAWRGHFA